VGKRAISENKNLGKASKKYKEFDRVLFQSNQRSAAPEIDHFQLLQQKTR
jgi:hypothetical protein